MKRKEKHMELGQNLGGMCTIVGLKEKMFATPASL